LPSTNVLRTLRLSANNRHADDLPGISNAQYRRASEAFPTAAGPRYNTKSLMAKTEQEHRQDIIEVGRLVYQKEWIASNDGNISIRLDSERILATPTGVCKGMMRPEDLIILDYEGNKIEGRLKETSEILMHLTIYKMRPDVGAVVHAHPPVATGFATSGRALDQALLPEVIIGLGCVPLAAYGLPGTPALTEPMLPFIPKYDAILMANHGAVSYGATVWNAFFNMETVEHCARINLVAELLGGPRVLPRREVEKLFASRPRYGVKTQTRPEPGLPVVAEDLESAKNAGGARRSEEATASADGEERYCVTRTELLALVNEALRTKR